MILSSRNGVEEILLTGGTCVFGDLSGTDIAGDTIILIAGEGAVNVTNNSDRSLEVKSSGANDTLVGGSGIDSWSARAAMIVLSIVGVIFLMVARETTRCVASA